MPMYCLEVVMELGDCVVMMCWMEVTKKTEGFKLESILEQK